MLAFLALFVVSGCTGIMQKSMPAQAASFVRVSDAAGEPLRVGVAAVDITPAPGIYLGGFDLAREATAVESPLEVRAVVYLHGATKVAVVGLDNLGLQREDVDWIKSGIAGFTNGCVVLCSSHTHAGPDLIGLWGWYFWTSGRDRDYVATVRRAVAQAVREAEMSARPARLVRGQARVPADGLFRNTNRAGVFDRRVTVLHARALDDDAPVGTLLHAACHPEVLRRRNTEISADFVGSLCAAWEARGHGPAVFVNGALGAMITPQNIGADGVQKAGEWVCDHAEQALTAAEPVPVDAVEIRRRDVFLPMQSWALRIARLTTVIPRDNYYGCLRSGVGYLRIGTFEACLVPGEAEPGYAQRITARARRPDMLLFGLADDEVGYLMSERDARDELFVYERTMSPGVMAGEYVLEALVGSGRF